MAKRNTVIFAAITAMFAIGNAQAQNSYVEVKGAADWMSTLSETISLTGGPIPLAAPDNTFLGSGETLFRTSTPAWHAGLVYGWQATDLLGLEIEGGYGRRTFDDNSFTSSESPVALALAGASGFAPASTAQWYDLDTDGVVDSGEIATEIPDVSAHIATLMLNGVIAPQLNDELSLVLGAGAGFIGVTYDDTNKPARSSATSFQPGYQLKGGLRFQANANTHYFVEGGFLGGLVGEHESEMNTGVTAGTYESAYSHFWTGFGVGYSF